jgi:hypothetical protein
VTGKCARARLVEIRGYLLPRHVGRVTQNVGAIENQTPEQGNDLDGVVAKALRTGAECEHPGQPVATRTLRCHMRADCAQAIDDCALGVRTQQYDRILAMPAAQQHGSTD